MYRIQLAEGDIDIPVGVAVEYHCSDTAAVAIVRKIIAANGRDPGIDEYAIKAMTAEAVQHKYAPGVPLLVQIDPAASEVNY